MARIGLPPIVLINNEPLPAVYSVEIQSPNSYEAQATIRIETIPVPVQQKSEPEFAPMLRAVADYFAEHGDQESQRRLMLMAKEGPRERAECVVATAVDSTCDADKLAALSMVARATWCQQTEHHMVYTEGTSDLQLQFTIVGRAPSFRASAASWIAAASAMLDASAAEQPTT